MTSASTEASPQLQTSSLGSCLGWLVFILAALWVISITLGRLAAQWFATGFLTSIPDSAVGILSRPPIDFPAAPPGFACLAIPLGYPQSTLPHLVLRSGLRPAPGAGIPALPGSHAAACPAQYPGSCLLFVAVLRRFPSPPQRLLHQLCRPAIHPPPGDPLTVLVIVALAGIPWALFGALGSPVDTLLQILAGLAFGLAVTQAFHTLLLPGLQPAGISDAASILLGGFCAAIALLVFSSGVGYRICGNPAADRHLLAAPWLAGDLPALSRENRESRRTLKRTPPHPTNRRGKWSPMLPLVLLIGISAAFPLVFIDPDELASGHQLLQRRADRLGVGCGGRRWPGRLSWQACC